MKILNLAVLAILWPASIIYGQNLVSNPSFEDYVDCPTGYSAIGAPMTTISVTDWYIPTLGSSDYFNPCATAASLVSVPENYFGYQVAKTGDAYAGWYGYVSCIPDYREYIEARLLTTLKAGHRYHVSYWISLGNDVPYATDQMGAFFSPDSLNDPLGATYIAETPQIQSPVSTLYTDTTGWVAVAGEFIATGDERWIVIGNFMPDADLNIEAVGGGMPASYYYMDDVCVLDMDTAAPENINMHDTLKCDDDELILKGRTGMGNFLWDNGSTGATRTIALAGTYWVRSVDSVNCRLLLDTFIIRGKQGPPVSLGNDTIICTVPPFMLIPQIEYEEPGELSLLWSDGSNKETLSIDSSGTYWLRVTTQEGCWSADTVNVWYYNVRQHLGADVSLCWGDPVNIQLQANVPEGATASWNTGASTPDIYATDTGAYWVIVNQPPCAGSDTIGISYEKCACWSDIPTVFSPNGDGLNDVFIPVIEAGCPVGEYVLSIYNRWGQRIFVGYTPQTSWDGTYNGKPADIGTYMYELKFTGGTRNNRYIKKGDVHLLR